MLDACDRARAWRASAGTCHACSTSIPIRLEVFQFRRIISPDAGAVKPSSGCSPPQFRGRRDPGAAQAAGQIGLAVRAHPGQQLQATLHQERRKLIPLSLGQAAGPAVALGPGIHQPVPVGAVLDEAERRSHIMQKPAQAAIIEIDNMGALAIHQQIGAAQVGMDQAEALRPRAEGIEPLTQQSLGEAQGLALCRRQARRAFPLSPMRGRAHRAGVVPDHALEMAGTPPGARLRVHAGAEPAQVALRGVQLVRIGKTAVDPAEQRYITRARRLARDALQHRAVQRGQGLWRADAGLVQRAHPVQLGLDGVARLVIRTVNPHRGLESGAPVLDPEHRVLGMAEQADVGARVHAV